MTRAASCFLFALSGCSIDTVAPNREPEEFRYVRMLRNGNAPECVFSIRRTDQGWGIESVTGSLNVTSRYDSHDTLLEAAAVQNRKPVTVEVRDGKAKVQRQGMPAQEFDVPKRVIVTSAPDWTDTLLISRFYRRGQDGKQEFPGLWIHPQQSAQRLAFAAENLGAATLEHNGERLDLLRLAIRLRGNSRYLAWVDPKGRMIKLVSLPFKEGVTELVLEGFETSAGALKPE